MPGTLPLSTIQLQCFVTVIESGSFAHAGRKLGLSASAVSKTISRLEETRGVRLLSRSTHSLSLTPEGEELIGIVRDALKSLEAVDLAISVSARESTGGRVRISMSATTLYSWFAPLLPLFRAAHPDVSLDIRTGDQALDLAQEGIDLALWCVRAEGVPGHLRKLLFRFKWVACASPAYLSTRDSPKTVQDLAAHELIGFRNKRTGTIDPWLFHDPRKDGQEVRWIPDAAIIVDSGNAAIKAVVAGAGIAWMTDWMIAEHLSSGAALPLLTDWSGKETEIFLVRRNHARNPARVDKVIQFLTRHAHYHQGA